MLKSSSSFRLSSGLGGLVVLSLLWGGCQAPPEVVESEATTVESEPAPMWRSLDPPAGETAMAPNLAVSGGQLLSTWIERVDREDEGSRHRLLFARLGDQGWSDPVVVSEGDNFFANWADIPALVVAEDGTFYVHWLAKTATDTYAYSIFLARSTDGGTTWKPLGPLNDDDTATEHGFVTWVPEGSGVRAFWLDGREMVSEEPMTLRTAPVVGDKVGDAEVLDTRVCECCSTDSAVTAQGPLVVFRDRSETEVRDIGIVRRTGEEWSRTNLVHSDNWWIEGCPVNGPETAAVGDDVAVAWFTAAGEGPQVRFALSSDAGATFDSPVQLDDGRPLGRVDVVADGAGGFVASWLEAVEAEAEVRLRRLDADGRSGESIMAGQTSSARASGFPRLARIDDLLYVAWLEILDDGNFKLHLAEIPLDAVPDTA